jgi:hypothetical protein
VAISILLNTITQFLLNPLPLTVNVNGRRDRNELGKRPYIIRESSVFIRQPTREITIESKRTAKNFLLILPFFMDGLY